MTHYELEYAEEWAPNAWSVFGVSLRGEFMRAAHFDTEHEAMQHAESWWDYGPIYFRVVAVDDAGLRYPHQTFNLKEIPPQDSDTNATRWRLEVKWVRNNKTYWYPAEFISRDGDELHPDFAMKQEAHAYARRSDPNYKPSWWRAVPKVGEDVRCPRVQIDREGEWRLVRVEQWLYDERDQALGFLRQMIERVNPWIDYGARGRQCYYCDAHWASGEPDHHEADCAYIQAREFLEIER